MVGLYSGLGTFVSSCGGSITYTTTSIGFSYSGIFSCVWPLLWTGNAVLFEDAVNNGWKLRISVNRADNGTALKTYDFVNSISSSGTTGGFLSHDRVNGIEVPQNISYTVSAILQSPCSSCGAGMGNAYFLRHVQNDPYPSGQIVGGILGTLSVWQNENCNLIF